MKNLNIVLAVVIFLFVLLILGGFGIMGFGNYGGIYGMISGFYGGFSFMWIFMFLFMSLVVIALILFILWLINQITINERRIK